MSQTPHSDGSRRNAKGRERNRGQRNQQGERGQQGQGRRYSQKAPSQRSRRADPARTAAFKVLRAVSRDDAYANLVLPAEIRRATLDRRDAGFATELTYGALRAQGTYDSILSRCVDRGLDQLDAPILDALRLGVHQLLAMRVTTHAAVNETVGLVRAEIGAGPSGFVNAVLRRVSEKSMEKWVEEISGAEEAGSDAALALQHAHPAWVVRALKQSLKLHGRGEELQELLTADNASPEVHLVELPGVGQKRLASALEAGAAASHLVEGAAVFRGGDVGRLPGVPESELRVQALGSQWIARALAGAWTPETTDPDVAGERWLDLCAGPGGKAALLAALAAEHGATLLANEPAAHRAELVTKALSAVPAEAWSVRAGDGRSIAETSERYDRILIDAPCTGLGALRRRPESRWRRKPADLAELTVLQEELLDAGVGVLAPGGVLAYVTCSPHPAETLVQVEDVLRRHPELQLLNAHEAMASASLPAGAEAMEATAGQEAEGGSISSKLVQLWPHAHGTDAMFFALLHKPGRLQVQEQ